jgi:hypothetical protein
MKPFHETMQTFKKQLQQGDIQAAYQEFIVYFRELKAHFYDNHPEFGRSGSIYYGYLDMTYFPLFPETLKRQKLKIAVVFIYDTWRFEVWLSGVNRQAQEDASKRIKTSGWDQYQLTSDPRIEDYILRHILVDDPDFSDLDNLTAQIERGTLAFIRDVEGFLGED